MNSQIKFNCISLLWLCFTACTQNSEIAETKKETSLSGDSLKFVFGNFDQRDFDSIYLKATEAVTEKGFKVDKILEKIALMDTNAYEYYAIYAFQLAKDHHINSALRCLNVGSKYVRAKIKGRYYLHKAILWGAVPPIKQRDTIYYYLDLAVKNDSLNPFMWATRSQFYREDSLYEKAISDIDKCLDLRPGDTDYVNCRGWYKLCAGNIKGALDDLKILSAASQENAYYYLYRAVCFNALAKYKDSFREANISIHLDPNNSKAYIMRANAKFHYLKDREGALEDARKAVALGDSEAIHFLNKIEAADR